MKTIWMQVVAFATILFVAAGGVSVANELVYKLGVYPLPTATQIRSFAPTSDIGQAIQLLPLGHADSRRRPNSKMWELSGGAFIPTDIPSGMSSSTGFSVAVKRFLMRGTANDLLVGFRYSQYDWSSSGVNGQTNLYSPTAEYHWRLGAQRRFYVGVGLGIVLANVSASGFGASASANKTDFAGSFLLGYEFPSIFVELASAGGERRAEQGFIISVGARF